MDVLDVERCLALLDRAPYADLAVTSSGRPYVAPISFVRDGDHLSFRSGPGERVASLTAEPAVCLSVVSFHEETGAWESVIARGEVSFVIDEEACAAVVALLIAKYGRYEPAIGISLPELQGREAVTFSLPLADVTGRSSGVSVVPRTRPGRL